MHFTSRGSWRCASLHVRASGALALALAALMPRPAAAQSEYTGAGCGPGIACAADGAPCAAGRRAIVLDDDVCRCVAVADAELGDPTFCCAESVMCRGAAGSSARCVDVTGSGTDICRTPDITLCNDDDDVVSLEGARACFTIPGTSTVQPYWRAGDCDGDEVPNGQEVVEGRDPCCNESTDLDCCIAAFDAPAHCCDVTGATDPIACCFEAGGDATACCSSADPIGCCTDAADSVGCCLEVGGTATDCCALDEDPAGCCFEAGGDENVCCALTGATMQRRCQDGAVDEDAGADRDASVPADAGVMDGGAGDDGGNTAEDAGSLGFGGGGGCRCAAQGSRAPSSMALLVAALALAIPSFRRRR